MLCIGVAKHSGTKLSAMFTSFLPDCLSSRPYQLPSPLVGTMLHFHSHQSYPGISRLEMTGHNTTQTAPSIRTKAGNPSKGIPCSGTQEHQSMWLNAVCSHAKQDEANMNTCWGMCPRNHSQKMHMHTRGVDQYDHSATRLQNTINLLVMQTAPQARQAVLEHLLRPQSQKVVIQATRHEQPTSSKSAAHFFARQGTEVHGHTMEPHSSHTQPKSCSACNPGGLGAANAALLYNVQTHGSKATLGTLSLVNRRRQSTPAPFSRHPA